MQVGEKPSLQAGTNAGETERKASVATTPAGFCFSAVAVMTGLKVNHTASPPLSGRSPVARETRREWPLPLGVLSW